jgi:hypothetical protein
MSGDSMGPLKGLGGAADEEGRRSSGLGLATLGLCADRADSVRAGSC